MIPAHLKPIEGHPDLYFHDWVTDDNANYTNGWIGKIQNGVCLWTMNFHVQKGASDEEKEKVREDALAAFLKLKI